MRLRGLTLLIVLAAANTRCSEDVQTIFIERCENDLGCAEGEICLDGECLPRDNVSCSEVEGGKAILQPGPTVIDFGHTGSGSSMASMVLRNIGDCTLTVFEAYFEKEDLTPFECPLCAAEHFPIELFPFRDTQLDIFFTPEEVGDYDDTLILLSDDAEFSEIHVPVRATFNGIPKIALAPDMIDFDYAPVGRTLQRQIHVSNKGTGTAPLLISRVEIQSSTVTAFSFTPQLAEPVSLDPISIDADDEVVFEVRYHPREIGVHGASLVLYTNQPGNQIVRVPLRGSSATPAKIKVSPDAIQFGPVPIGQTTALPLTIVNEGGSPLRVTYHWTGVGLSTDLSALPAVVPAIQPGQYTEMQVLVTATAPAPITGLLIIESNDPSRPSVTVAVSADGQPVVGAQVLKIEMHYDNGSDSVWDDDFRNVDLTLENPFGLICNKQTNMPTNWGAFGNPTWLAFGPKEEPERVVLPDSMQDGIYRILLTYQEDCSSVASGLVAALLGISIDVLIAYFTGGVGIGVSGSDVSSAIDDVCFDHSSSAVTVTIYLNGQIIAEVPKTVGRKGDYVYAADLIRTGGVFTVMP